MNLVTALARSWTWPLLTSVPIPIHLSFDIDAKKDTANAMQAMNDKPGVLALAMEQHQNPITDTIFKEHAPKRHLPQRSPAGGRKSSIIIIDDDDERILNGAIKPSLTTVTPKLSITWAVTPESPV